MPTEIEIKKEMLEAIGDKPHRKIVEQEIDDWASKEDAWGKPCIQKVYNQWKSGKKGHRNPFNSWTGYYLGLTTQQPNSNWDFHTRRAFARPSPPDIDSDFDYERRDEIIDDKLVVDYGRGCVGNIGTRGALKTKSALTRIIKALDIADAFDPKNTAAFTPANLAKVTEILGTIPKQRGAVLKVRNKQGEEVVIKTVVDLVKTDSSSCDDFRYYMEKYPDIYAHAKNIEGLLSIFSVHASGIVLSDVPLEEIAPLRTAKDTGGTVSLATQFSYEDLEYLGLIKFDVLAISTLTVMAETIRMVKENLDIDIDVENLPLDDKKTFDLYKSGKLCGVFQCEGDGMIDTCVDVGVDRFDDIMAVISLYRPGPMDSIPEYCERKHGRKPVSYFHPTIEPLVKHILGPTYGVLVYQEQVMRICEAIASMTPSEALVVIKGISKKKEEVINKGRSGFISGAIKNGVPKEVAQQYWDKFITPFAAYGFNAAHCLTEDMRVLDKNSNQFFTIEQLSKMSDYEIDDKHIILDSYTDGKLSDDKLVRAFSTGEQEVYEVELTNGMIIKCTIKHRFYCTDGLVRTLSEIIEGDYEIICESTSGCVSTGVTHEKNLEQAIS